MRFALIVVISVFVIAFVLGCLKAKQDGDNVDRMEIAVIDHMFLRCPKDDIYCYVYFGDVISEERADMLFRYNIDSKQIEELSEEVFYKRDEIAYQPVSNEQVLALLGGSVGGATVTKLMPNPSRSTKTKATLIASILAAVSGYGVGYKYGSSDTYDYNDKEILTFLSSQDAWASATDKYIMHMVRTNEMEADLRNARNDPDSDMTDIFLNSLEKSRETALSMVRTLRWYREGRNEEIIDGEKAILPFASIRLKELIARYDDTTYMSPTELYSSQTIDNPWWSTWWFNVSMAVIGLLGAMLIVVRANRKPSGDEENRAASPRKRTRIKLTRRT